MMGRRVFLTGVVTGLAVAANRWLGSSLEVVSYRVDLVERPVARLRVVVLSDPHVIEPWMGLDRWSALVAQTNALNPDLVVLGGDYSGYNLRHDRLVMPAEIAKTAGRLRSPLGVLAVMGNHDWLADPLFGIRWQGKLALAHALEAEGITVLNNRHAVLEHQGRLVTMAGVDSDIEGRFVGLPKAPQDVEKALANAPADVPIVLLAHEPDVFARIAPRVALQVSGHMHAGQVRLGSFTPGALPSRYGTRYLHGHIEEQGTPLIVSGGLGYSRLPVRIGAPSEIVVVDLGI